MNDLRYVLYCKRCTGTNLSKCRKPKTSESSIVGMISASMRMLYSSCGMFFIFGQIRMSESASMSRNKSLKSKRTYKTTNY